MGAGPVGLQLGHELVGDEPELDGCPAERLDCPCDDREEPEPGAPDRRPAAPAEPAAAWDVAGTAVAAAAIRRRDAAELAGFECCERVRLATGLW